jgi:hypothetical protein
MWTTEAREKARLKSASRKVLKCQVDVSTATAFGLIASRCNTSPAVLLSTLIDRLIADYISKLDTADAPPEQ